ncbi:MAG TPA: polyprenyl synthetase family protein [Candidatus Acidoferrales bacterium]|nr:polyprenyl synthetase family protein [Candidatus Acidoferrales bacterium]
MITTTQSAIRGVVEEFVREELSLENAQIAGAVWAMLDAGGKELRPRMTMLAARATNSQASPDPILASYMELIHVATLIHDDVVDNAALRRGRDSTNSVHGNRFSVLAGDYLFAWVFKKITQGYDNPVPTILASMLSEICNGEVKQLKATGNLALRRDEYFEIIGKKTAELFASCAEVGSIVALQRATGASGPKVRDHPTVRALREYGWAFGMGFQVRDDLLDVIASESTIGKPAGSDLRECKVTLPLIAALESGDPTIKELAVRYFRGDGGGDASQTLAVLLEQLRSSVAVAQTKRVVAQYENQALAAIEGLPLSEATAELQALTRTLSEYSS